MDQHGNPASAIVAAIERRRRESADAMEAQRSWKAILAFHARQARNGGSR